MFSPGCGVQRIGRKMLSMSKQSENTGPIRDVNAESGGGGVGVGVIEHGCGMAELIAFAIAMKSGKISIAYPERWPSAISWKGGVRERCAIECAGEASDCQE